MATVSVLSLVACGDKQDAKDPHEHVWGEWERVTAPTCETVGKKKRTCTLDETHTEEADIVALQHNFGNQGICEVCEEPVVLPEEEANPTFVDPLDLKENKTNVTGDPFHWYKCGEGYYEFTVNSVEKPKETWITFSVKEAGQYALYSIENEKGVTVERFDASAHYIPVDESGNYIGFAGRTLENGNFISTVNCSQKYFNSEWRATFRLSGKTGSTVKLRFVKIAEPLWQPSYLYTSISATEINGKKGCEEYGVSAGFSIPIVNKHNNRSHLHISGQFIHMEPKSTGMIAENYLRINIGISCWNPGIHAAGL